MFVSAAALATALMSSPDMRLAIAKREADTMKRAISDIRKAIEESDKKAADIDEWMEKVKKKYGIKDKP